MHYYGYIAAALVTISFVPQALKTIKSNDTEAISLVMYIMFFIGVLLWLVYGVLINDWAQIIANGIVFILSGLILFMKVRGL